MVNSPSSLATPILHPILNGQSNLYHHMIGTNLLVTQGALIGFDGIAARTQASYVISSGFPANNRGNSWFGNPVVLVFDTDIFTRPTTPGTMMTNAGHLEWGVEFYPADLLKINSGNRLGPLYFETALSYQGQKMVVADITR